MVRAGARRGYALMPGRSRTQPAERSEPTIGAVGPGIGEEQAAFVAPRRRRYWIWFAAVALAMALSAAGWHFWRTGEAPPPSYVTAPVERGSIEDTITAIGTLQPLGFVDVGTQVSGQLGKLHVDVGDRLAQGDLLAEIISTIYQARVEAGRAQLLAQRAQLADRQAQLVLARQQFERQERLMREGATSQDAHQSAAAVFGSAAAQVDVLRAQIQNTESTLKADEANLGYTKIYAPMAGTVVSLTAKQGQTLNANQQAPIILRIADLSTMTVTAQVSEADVGRLPMGMEAYFTTLGLGSKRWYGILRKILPTPEVINNVVLYNALFDVPNPTGELMTQMTAQVFFVAAAAENALLIPMAALVPPQAARPRAGGDGRPRPEPTVNRNEAAAQATNPQAVNRRSVQVLRDDGSVEQRSVRIGVTNRVSAQVLEGLEPGERVIVGGRRPAQAPAEAPRPTPRLS